MVVAGSGHGALETYRPAALTSTVRLTDSFWRAGFRIAEMKTSCLRGPCPVTYTCEGLAQRSQPEK